MEKPVLIAIKGYIAVYKLNGKRLQRRCGILPTDSFEQVQEKLEKVCKQDS